MTLSPDIKYFVTLCILFIPVLAFSQNSKPDTKFLKYLSDKEFHDEVIFIIENYNNAIENQELEDSLNYLNGWSYYSIKELKKSAKNLNKISPSSPFYFKSKFFSAYNYMHLGQYQKSKEILKQLEPNTNNHEALLQFELAGNALLRREYKEFNHHITETNRAYYPIKKEIDKLNEYAVNLENHKPKSTLLATMMSGIIPGSGKIYAGKTGEGISSLITVGGMGFVTWENYHKAGPTHFKTLFFGAVFAVFYFGNLYGTYFTVKIAEKEFQDEYDNKILFNLHIPLRSVFN